jgi:hydroxymethylbilane synthase
VRHAVCEPPLSLSSRPPFCRAGLAIVAVTERGETEDALVLHEKHRGATLESLPAGAVIGTSALRRRAALARLFPKLSCKDVRGNLQTRLAKLDRGEYDALILAAVGLRRIGLGHRISAVLSADKFGYAVGQGALAVVARTG